MLGTTPHLHPWGSRALALGLLFAAEIVALAMLYQVGLEFECRATGAEGLCDALRGLVARALTVGAALVLLARARPAALAALLAAAQGARGHGARAVHLAGLALLLVPLALAGQGGALEQGFGLFVWAFLIGAGAAAGGGVLWVAPAAAWGRFLLAERGLPLAVLAVAAVIPDLAALAWPLWDVSWMASATFLGVALLLGAAGGVELRPDERILGLDGFRVHVAENCSGVEGLALVTGFVVLYAVIFRAEVRTPRFLLVALPVGLALSWLLNVVRIAALITIGARVSPDLAVNGFHSHAGWLFFTLLAVALMAVVPRVGWLHRTPQARAVPVAGDPAAAALLPFAAFMMASLVVAALVEPAAAGMPLVTLALAAACLPFAAQYRQLDWRLDPVAGMAGLGIGVGWVLTAGAPDPVLAAALALLPGWALALWVGLRLAGTVVLVPLVEEMLFRGYLLARLGAGSRLRMAAAVVLSTAAFAALHGRWIEAGLAGLLFAWVALRRGRVADAILAHMVANATIAAVAWARGDWSLI
jgi:hypothetical protein